MRRLNSIIESQVQPTSTNSLWLDKGVLKYLKNGIWKNVNPIIEWENIIGKPEFATVATSGDYNDLLNTPPAYTLPAATNSSLGGIKKGESVADTDATSEATAQSVATTLNLLLAQLRLIGVINV